MKTPVQGFIDFITAKCKMLVTDILKIVDYYRKKTTK